MMIRFKILFFLVLSVCLSLISAEQDGTCSENGALGKLKKDIGWLKGHWPVEEAANGTLLAQYQISICSELPVTPASSCPRNTAVCRYANSTYTQVGNFTTTPIVTQVDSDGLTSVKFRGGPCADSPGSFWNTTINLKCGKSLGSPELVESYACEIVFEWVTSAACKSKTTNAKKEVRCYVYDHEHRKRDLSPLIKREGGYLVRGSDDNDNKQLYINVCRDINPAGATSGCPANSAACLIPTGSSPVSIGEPSGQDYLQATEDGKNVILTYRVDTAPSVCQGIKPTVTINFECVAKGKSEPPVFEEKIGNKECQYIVNWKTVYACPEETLVSTSCKLSSDIHGVDIDLTPLRKDTGSYTVDGPNTNEYTFHLNVCGDAGVPCPDEQHKAGIAACQTKQSQIEFGKDMGHTSDTLLRYDDGNFTLTFGSGARCSSHFRRETVINFYCNQTAEDGGKGKPVYVGEDTCTYMFDWGTKYVCINEAATCYVNHGNQLYDISILGVKEYWEANHPGDSADPYKQYLVQPCGYVSHSGDATDCPKGAAVCAKPAAGSAVSLGKFTQSPTYNEQTHRVEMRLTDGSPCPGNPGKTMESSFSLTCKQGDLESGPSMVSHDGCVFMFEWQTAAACVVQNKIKGSDCKIYDQQAGYNFDLSPLTNNSEPNAYYAVNSTEAPDHKYFINICASVKGTKCDDGHTNAGVCQHTANGVFKTGEATSTLEYENGIIRIVYQNGDKYSNGKNRATEIDFICDRTVGKGYPEFVGEIRGDESKYRFRWSTSLACPTLDVECVYEDKTTGKQYDLSDLAQGKDNWWTEKDDHTEGYYINVCRSLNKVPVGTGCNPQTSACSVTIENGQKKIKVDDLGRAKSQLTKEGEYLVLRYTDGARCKEGAEGTTYSTKINFKCDRQALNSVPKPEPSTNPCEKVFMWHTERACEEEDVTMHNCTITDPDSGYTLDLKELALSGGYQAGEYQVNICGHLTGTACSTKSSKSKWSVCKGSQPLTGMTLDLTLEDGKQIVLTYSGEKRENDGQLVQARLVFECNLYAHKANVSFKGQEGDTYIFQVDTVRACMPRPISCQVSNSHGQMIDLSVLNQRPYWSTNDTRAHHDDIDYYLSVCKPLGKVDGLGCSAGIVGACQKTRGQSFNMGYVLNNLEISAADTVTLRYVNGDLCHAGKNNQAYRSTAITFICSTNGIEKGPVFADESDTCEYSFMWETPAACPSQRVTGDNCRVTEPQYHRTFELNSLYKPTSHYEVTAGEYKYLLNVCGPLHGAKGACAGEEVGACQTKPSVGDTAIIKAGNFNKNLTYNLGELSLVYEHGKDSCHGKFERKTIMKFSCDHQTSGINGPTFVNETESCTYVFDWATSLACHAADFKMVECSVQNNGSKYSLDGLTLKNDNYLAEAFYPKKLQFILNVCTTLVRSKDMGCPPGTAACMVDPNETDPAKRYTSIGTLTDNSLTYDKGIIMRLPNGAPCDTNNQVNSSTNIQFRCKKDQGTTSDIQYLYKTDSCEYHFFWFSPLACPRSTSAIIGGDCSVRDDVTGTRYDLSTLKNDKGYEMSDSQGNKYTLNICDSVKGSACGDSSGICVTSANQHHSGGKASAKSEYVDGSILLKYPDGDPCAAGPRQTLIMFRCSSDEEEQGPSLDEDSTDCVHRITFRTSLLCRHKVSCQVSNGVDTFDLSSLGGAIPYTAVTPGGTDTKQNKATSYYLNVCSSLGSVPGVQCPAAAAACRVEQGQKPVSIGHVHQSPTIDQASGHVMLEYDHGTKCGSGKQTITRIIFFCAPGVPKGVPEFKLVSPDKCEYLFEWRTQVVCSKTGETNKDKCTYHDKSLLHTYDFSVLQAKESYQVRSPQGELFYVDVCRHVRGSEVPPGCLTQQAAVCSGDANSHPVSYGKADQIKFVDEGDTIVKMIYQGGTKCQEGINAASYILFHCDKCGEGNYPVLVHQDGKCSALFSWGTPAACPPVVKQCVISSDGNMYDLSALSQAYSSWQVKDTKTNTRYWLNICRGIQKVKGCPPWAAVCKQTYGGNMEVLGMVETQELTIDKNNGLSLVYHKSGPCGVGSSGENTVVTVKFECGKVLGSPQFRQSSGSSTEFSWRSSMACKEERIAVKPDESGIVTDKDSGVKVDLKKVTQSKIYETSSRLQKDVFIYKMNLLKAVDGCQGAAICRQKNGSKDYTNLGDLSSANYFFENNILEIVYTSATPCEHDQGAEFTTSIVDIHCSQGQPDTGPKFMYKNHRCYYFFIWYSPEACITVNTNSALEDIPGQQHANTATVVIAVMVSLLSLTVLVIIFAKQERRQACWYKVSRLCRKRGYVSFRYSQLSVTEDEENTLLDVQPVEISATDITPDAPASPKPIIRPYRDDSDEELIL